MLTNLACLLFNAYLRMTNQANETKSFLRRAWYFGRRKTLQREFENLAFEPTSVSQERWYKEEEKHKELLKKCNQVAVIQRALLERRLRKPLEDACVAYAKAACRETSLETR